MVGKWLELLKEIVPSVSRVTFIFNPDTAPGGGSYFLKPAEAAAGSFGLNVVSATTRASVDIERAMDAVAREPGGAIVVIPDTFLVANYELVIATALRNRLPVIYPFTFWGPLGGLIAYGVDSAGEFRRAATYVDRVLRGTSPSDLPVQAPTRFELVINLKTAKAMGLNVSPNLLTRADEVIE